MITLQSQRVQHPNFNKILLSRNYQATCFHKKSILMKQQSKQFVQKNIVADSSDSTQRSKQTLQNKKTKNMCDSNLKLSRKEVPIISGSTKGLTSNQIVDKIKVSRNSQQIKQTSAKLKQHKSGGWGFESQNQRETHNKCQFTFGN